jgi:hypothetical protein
MVGNFGTNVGVSLQVQNMASCMMSLEEIWVGANGQTGGKNSSCTLVLPGFISFGLFNVFGGFALGSCF